MKKRLSFAYCIGVCAAICVLALGMSCCKKGGSQEGVEVSSATACPEKTQEVIVNGGTAEPTATNGESFTQAPTQTQTSSPGIPQVSFDPNLLPVFTSTPLAPRPTVDVFNPWFPSVSFAPGTSSIAPTGSLTPTFTANATGTPVVSFTARPTATQSNTSATTSRPTATAKPTATPKPSPTTIPEEDVIVAKKQNKTFSTTASVTTSGNSASVKTASGLQYTASGFTGYSGGKFSINQNFKITFDDNVFTKNFNRFTLCYVSSQPLKGKITYTVSGASKTDEFFLEAGTNTFSCLISDYLKNKKGAKISSITVSTCKGVSGTFLLCDCSCEDYTVFSNDVYYLENGKYKVGVRLLWGGGISYIYDKDTPVKGLTNLVNQADTGRLIQQSYYGTGANGQYTPGYFNGSVWAYNPVQGGDQYGNHSRIIDIVVEDYSIYIKSQPQDWSLNGKITPSYMENSYTLYGDRIQVDNRFVDFSGWTHRYADQELPAFYTVSYLDKFTWYDGSDGWTGDTLTSRSDLNFWGDPAYHNDCIFPIRNSNKETWCSWTNSSVDYGIGLYVPNVDIFLAGKHAYNGSMNAYNGACNYVAPLNVMLLVSYDALEYSYLITTGSVNDIRETFLDNKDFADNASLHKNYISSRVADGGDPLVFDFTAEANASLLEATNNTKVKYEKPKGALKLQATDANDVQTYIDFSALGSYKASDYKTLTIEYMVPTKNKGDSYSFELFLCTGNTLSATAGKSVKGNYTKDGQYHTVEISLKDLSFWNGKINGIRFDYFDGCVTNDELFIKSITLS